jgi:hypothetical protein
MVFTSRQTARRRACTPLLVLSALLLAGGCSDKSGATSRTGNAAGDVADSAHRQPGSPAATANTPAGGASTLPAGAAPASTGPTPGAEQKAIESASGPLPKRSRQDSVALASMTKGDSALDKLWPVKMAPPLPGALLPANRIVAFYGNPLSKKMGVLGEYPKDARRIRVIR